MTRNWRNHILVAFLALTITISGLFSPVYATEDTELIKKASSSTVMLLLHNRKNKKHSQASGFFVSSNGEIITSNHVLEGTSQIIVKTRDGQKYTVTGIVAQDIKSDLVRLKVELPVNTLVTPLKINENIPQIDEKIFIIGNPGGREGIVTRGKILSLPHVPNFGPILRTDASIAPGSSGSPMLNSRGEVIGVAAFQFSGNGENNFAIPSAKILSMAPVDNRSAEKELAEQKDQSVEKLFHLAKKKLHDKEYQKALQLFKAIQDQYASSAGHLWKDWEIWFYIGSCQGQLGMASEAVESFLQAIKLMPEIALNHYSIGVAYNQLGLQKKAKTAYSQAITLQPDLKQAHFNLGLTCFYLHDNACVTEELRSLTKLDPSLAHRLAVALHQ
ncbi:MAG: trypsin-like peptidase domain-containing protein [Desulfobulbaceae bacterium]|nr:trypsin-like peptidase domain-containing protein [Desulfobulbaceae bacterium]